MNPFETAFSKLNDLDLNDKENNPNNTLNFYPKI